jgi:ATP-dependent RNA helicase RhlE
MTFNELNLIEPLLKALTAEGYTTPTPIQEKAIPILLQKNDLLGVAQTGTGKTAAFALPIIQLLMENKKNNEAPHHAIQCLILTPTRELAIQIDESFAAYGKHCNIKHTVIFGGVSQHHQVLTLKRGVDILIATPGRLLDLGEQGFLNLKHLKIFVLDEADRMLDMGFINDVRRIITKIPQQRQTLFFSATMPPEIQKLSESILKNPIKIEVTPVSSTADTIEQTVYHVEMKMKKSLLKDLLQDEAIKSALVFTRTKHGADKVVKDLLNAGTKAAAIHGNKSQNARQLALSNFKSGAIRVLVATDIAARGIDVDNLSHVFNFELPNIPETYVHRIGRTGRAGASGKSISFCDKEELEYLRDIQKLIGKKIPVVTEHPYLPTHNTSTEAPKQSGNSAAQRPRQGGGSRGNFGNNRNSGNNNRPRSSNR